jgi:hypothetical protein
MGSREGAKGRRQAIADGSVPGRPNKRVWRLPYARVIEKAGNVAGILRLR